MRTVAQPPLTPGPLDACGVTCRAACAQTEVRAKSGCEAVCRGELAKPERAGLCGAVDAPRIRVVGALARQAITQEAVRNLEDLFDRSVTYFQIHRKFPAEAGPVPERLCAGPDGMSRAGPAAWDHPTWKALGFRLEGPFFYRYSYRSEGEGPGATVTIVAEGDLDCNGVLSRFEKSGTADPGGTVAGRPVSSERAFE
jgi:hypothetical protein